jgi:hypothetical protein
MSTPLPLEANDELVAVAWLATVPGLSAAMVGTQLPPDVNADGTPAPWLGTGFVTVSVVGGNPDDLLPINQPVIQVDCWATVPGSNKPPWWKAYALASAIKRATWNRYQIPRPLLTKAANVAYPTAVVQSAYITTAFRRVYGDDSDYARLQGDLALTWITANDRLD